MKNPAEIISFQSVPVRSLFCESLLGETLQLVVNEDFLSLAKLSELEEGIFDDKPQLLLMNIPNDNVKLTLVRIARFRAKNPQLVVVLFDMIGAEVGDENPNGFDRTIDYGRKEVAVWQQELINAVEDFRSETLRRNFKSYAGRA